ncbi:MAG: thioesterase family protein [Woeseia sp.]
MTAAGVSIADGRVLPEWIDLNGHMNVAYYVLAFDLGVDALWEQLGITTEYIETSRCSTFAVESHVTYQRELKEGEPYHITAQILAYDYKRIHQFQRMHQADTMHVVATGEWMNLHVDLATRRVTPFPRPILSALHEFTKRQGDLPTPVEAGQTIAVRKPIFSGN